MARYQELIEGLEVTVTDGIHKGKQGRIAYIDMEDAQVMVHLGEKNRESNKPIVHPFGIGKGLNKIEYLEIKQQVKYG